MRSSHTKFVELLGDAETFKAFLDDESSDSFRSSLRVSLGVDDQDVCVGTVLQIRWECEHVSQSIDPYGEERRSSVQ